jgi:hypothetical protein
MIPATKLYKTGCFPLGGTAGKRIEEVHVLRLASPLFSSRSQAAHQKYSGHEIDGSCGAGRLNRVLVANSVHCHRDGRSA